MGPHGYPLVGRKPPFQVFLILEMEPLGGLIWTYTGKFQVQKKIEMGAATTLKAVF
jgi:hypothetical protein